MTSRYLLPALRAVRDGAIEPSPSPALILEYGRAVVENCGFVVGQPIDTVVDDKTLLRIWELVEFKASAKGG